MVKNITRLAATGRRQRFIRCDVDDMQHIAEYIVANRREKAKIAVACPFEPHVLAAVLHDGAVNSWFASQPLHGEARSDQQCNIRFCRRGNDFFAIMKNIDVIRVPGAVAIERDGACDVAFRIPMLGQQPENFALDSRERHGKPARSQPRGRVISGHPLGAGFRQ